MHGILSALDFFCYCTLLTSFFFFCQKNYHITAKHNRWMVSFVSVFLLPIFIIIKNNFCGILGRDVVSRSRTNSSLVCTSCHKSIVNYAPRSNSYTWSWSIIHFGRSSCEGRWHWYKSLLKLENTLSHLCIVPLHILIR